MIKTLIKHKIFEVCINTMFNNIQRNMNSVPKMSIGAKFNTITTRNKRSNSKQGPIYYINRIYINCTIISIEDNQWIEFQHTDIDSIYECDLDGSNISYYDLLVQIEPERRIIHIDEIVGYT